MLVKANFFVFFAEESVKRVYYMLATLHSKPMIMACDSALLHFIQVSPSDMLKGPSRMDTEEESSVSSFVPDENEVHTYPKVKPKRQLDLPRSASWSFSL